MSETKSTIVLTDARGTAKSTACPRCGKGKEFRVLSSGFGEPHDVCRHCGHDFDERTLP